MCLLSVLLSHKHVLDRFLLTLDALNEGMQAKALRLCKLRDLLEAQLEGGETLFPCVRPAGDRASGLSRDAIGEAACERLVARVNESEARILWPSMYKDSFAPGVADYVSALCNAEPRPAGVLRVNVK